MHFIFNDKNPLQNMPLIKFSTSKSHAYFEMENVNIRRT